MMATTTEILAELKKKGSAQTRKIFARHGAPEDTLFGVKVGDLKPIAKQIKGQQQLACDLYDSGISDAMYLAGLVADGSQMKKSQLDKWAKQATWYMISEYTVPGVAAESPFATDLCESGLSPKKIRSLPAVGAPIRES